MARNRREVSASSTEETRLRDRVDLMRALGVLAWDGVVLGPAPVPGAAATAKPQPTQREAEEAAVRASRARVRSALSATGLTLPDDVLDRLGKVVR